MKFDNNKSLLTVRYVDGNDSYQAAPSFVWNVTTREQAIVDHEIIKMLCRKRFLPGNYFMNIN